MPRRGERALPALSAVLLSLSYPPLHPLVLPFVALVPLALFVAGRSRNPEGAAAARRGGALFAVLHFGTVLYWVPIALLWLSPAGPGVYVVGLVLFGLAGAGVGHLLHYLVRGIGAPVWLALPVAWTALEWGLAHLPGGVAYPWLGLGSTLTGFPTLVGVAELVGARGVGFWIALVNGLIAQAVIVRDGGRTAPGAEAHWGGVRTAEAPPGLRRPRRWVVASVVVALLPMAWGVRRAATLETWSVGRTALLQTNLPQSVRMDPARAPQATWDALDRLVASIEPGTIDLAVAPEMLLPVVPDAERGATMAERVRRYARELGAPILFGAEGRHEAGGDRRARMNSVYLMEPGGLADFRWDKHHLVPLVERRLGLVSRFTAGGAAGDGAAGDGVAGEPAGGEDFRAGAGWPLADAAGAGYGAMICFESAFPEVARGLRRAGADVLVNVTNDAWFGDDVGDARTTALWQHPAHLIMRAIETRTAVVRVGNAGLSFWVDPVGRSHDVIDAFTEAAVVAEVSTSDVDTLFVRIGDVLGNACGVSGLLLLLVSVTGGPRRRKGEAAGVAGV